MYSTLYYWYNTPGQNLVVFTPILKLLLKFQPHHFQPERCPKSDFSPCVSARKADARFEHCCAHLGEGCANLCTHKMTHRMVRYY